MSDPKHWNYLFKATCNTCYHNQCALPEKKTMIEMGTICSNAKI